MSTLDICIAICFVPFIIKGMSKGFIAQAMALISIVLGVWIAYKFTKIVCGWVFPEAAAHTIACIVTFILILAGVIIGLYLLGKLLQISLKFVMLGWVDKALGILFSVLEAALIIGLILILFNTINVKFHLVNVETLDKSLFFNPIKNFADTVFPYLKLLLLK